MTFCNFPNKLELKTFTKILQVYSPRKITITKPGKDKMKIRRNQIPIYFVWLETTKSFCLKSYKAQPLQSDIPLISVVLWIEFNSLESVHFNFNMPHFSYLALKTTPLDLWTCNLDCFSDVVFILIVNIDKKCFYA